MRFWGLVIVVIGLVLITPRAKAQIVTLPIPGSPLSLNIQANPLPLQELKNNPAATAHNLYDDSWVNVPLQFSFPFYGQNFDMSTMYSNGAVQFGRPVAEGGWPSWNNSFCCQGIRLNANTPEGYHYSILPLQTDLAGWQGNQHYTLGNGNSMTYGWYGVEQFGYSGNKSSFELKIDKTGGIDMRWSGALISYTPVTIGTVGNASQGQFTENYHGAGINIGAAQLTTGVVDQCIINPLSSPTCAGYAEAYKTQQCAISALYDPSCPGYQQAYFSQQCTANPLYNSGCPGYQTAYFTQQCTANPLYNSGCPGYQQAYFDQQCSLSALYSPNCPGYASAYQTYLANQACTANPQSSPSCSGYVAPVVTTTTTTSMSTSTTPQLVADPVVNQTITTTSTTTAPTAPAAPVQLVTPVATSTQQTTTALVVESVQSQSSSNTSSSSSSSTASSTSATTAPTARQSLQQARVEAARQQAVAKGAEAVKESGEAKSMTAQVATQGLVIAAMGFNPGFDAYNNVIMKDASFYRPFTIYGGQRTVDNRSAASGLFGSTDRLHNQMVDQQYQLGR
jgi:hypothetical protein